MAEFSVASFTEEIRKNLYDNFPYEKGGIDTQGNGIKDKKHKNRPLHIRDIAFGYLPSVKDGDTIYFDIGSDYAEEYYPYYHILEDAEVIRKRGKGTKLSKGSQAKVEVAGGKRDYGRINFNGKTYTREYRKNVRGERSRIGKATRYITGSDGRLVKINANADYYENIHYHYIERILDTTLPWIAQMFNLRMGRTEITDLVEEYNAQESADRVVNAMNSMMGD